MPAPNHDEKIAAKCRGAPGESGLEDAEGGGGAPRRARLLPARPPLLSLGWQLALKPRAGRHRWHLLLGRQRVTRLLTAPIIPSGQSGRLVGSRCGSRWQEEGGQAAGKASLLSSPPPPPPCCWRLDSGPRSLPGTFSPLDTKHQAPLAPFPPSPPPSLQFFPPLSLASPLPSFTPLPSCPSVLASPPSSPSLFFPILLPTFFLLPAFFPSFLSGLLPSPSPFAAPASPSGGPPCWRQGWVGGHLGAAWVEGRTCARPSQTLPVACPALGARRGYGYLPARGSSPFPDAEREACPLSSKYMLATCMAVKLT